MVTEACNLLFANLRRDTYDLYCEKQYSLLVHPGGILKHITGRTRADLILVKKNDKISAPTNQNFARAVYSVIEVKRGSAQWGGVQSDLRRLAEFKHHNQNARAFLLLVSEGQLPETFVDDGGWSQRGKKIIKGERAHYRVRRTCKAARTFQAVDTAHYACMIEVFANPALKKLDKLITPPVRKARYPG